METFYINLQPWQYFFNLAKRSQTDYEQIIKVLSRETFEKEKSYYSEQTVDCIIPVCTLQDENGDEFVVIDTNNDEDLTNDPILTYVEKSFQYGNRTLNYKVVDCQVCAEYFDGISIQTKLLPIMFRKVLAKQVHPQCAIGECKLGNVTIAGKNYRAVLNNQRDLEYTKFDQLWIDTNLNYQHDKSDFFEQLHQPFTLLGETYQLVEIDRFGNYLIIEPCDAEVVPPIQTGVPAPDFTATTLKSKEFKLSDLRGKWVLLDFWGTWCGPCLAEIPHLKMAYEKYREKGLEIVSIGIDDPTKLRTFVNEKNLNWIHIQLDKQSALLKLYQVGGFPTLFLINKNGIIVETEFNLRGEDLRMSLEKYLR